MKNIFIGLILFYGYSVSAKVSHGKWELVKNEHGIKVYNRQRSDKMREFKAIAYVKDVKLSAILAVMDDTANYKNWMGGVVNSYLVRKINMYERISYTHIDAPWPVSDRDSVSYSRIRQNKKDKSITIRMWSKPNAIPRREGIVRVPKSGGYFWFKPLKNRVTMMIYQQYSNPGGSIPNWVLKMAGHKVPLETMRKLRIMVKKPKYSKRKFSQILEPW